MKVEAIDSNASEERCQVGGDENKGIHAVAILTEKGLDTDGKDGEKDMNRKDCRRPQMPLPMDEDGMVSQGTQNTSYQRVWCCIREESQRVHCSWPKSELL